MVDDSLKVKQDCLQNTDFEVRDMRTADLIQVLAIERHAQPSPWSRLSFEESLTREHYCRVITEERNVVAYHIVCPVADELHVLNIVVAPNFQGLGLGHKLMHDIFNIAGVHALTKIFLEVRDSNKIAQSLYLKWQFQQIAIRKHYYRTEDNREDALIFMCQL